MPLLTTDNLEPSVSSADAGHFPVGEIATLTIIRLVFNSAYRMVYPFLPVVSRGLGVSTDTGRLLISARSSAGLVSPFFGSLSDRVGRRVMMLVSLLLFALTMAIIPVAPVFVVALGAFALMGIAKVIYDTAALAYVGDRVSYQRRGLAMGIGELGWAGGLFVGAPLIGLSIRFFGWSSPFVGIAGLAMVSFVLILLLIPSDRNLPGHHKSGVSKNWGLLLNNRAATGAAGFTFLLGLANESIFAVYGQWMEGTFGLEVAVLGLVTIVIGGADLLGELLVAGTSDRFGKRRMILLGLVGTSVGYASLPWIGLLGLPAALAVMFIMFLSFETAFVASLPLISEILPEARGTMMAAILAASSLGRMVGALLGGWLWNIGGFELTGFAAGLINVLALLLALAVIAEIVSPFVEAVDGHA